MRTLNRLIGDCPNVYAYTKALGEQLLLKEFHCHDLPLIVIRPSIITPALKEPLPGWTDNMNGPTGSAVQVVLFALWHLS